MGDYIVTSELVTGFFAETNGDLHEEWHGDCPGWSGKRRTDSNEFLAREELVDKE